MTPSKGTMKVSPIERVMLAAFRLHDANKAYRAAIDQRKKVKCCAVDEDEDREECWKYRRSFKTDSDIAEMCSVCIDALPQLRSVLTTWKARNVAKAYFWKAVGKVKR